MVSSADDPQALSGEHDTYKVVENPNGGANGEPAYVVQTSGGTGKDSAKLNYLLQDIAKDPGQSQSLAALSGKVIVIGATINSETATDQNFVNGMLNNTLQAIVNGTQQTGSNRFNVAYNPTHGVIGDLLESGVDKLFGNSVIRSGVSKQTESYIVNTIKSRADQYIQIGGDKRNISNINLVNFVTHSQGGLITNAALNGIKPGSNDLGSMSGQTRGVTVFTNGSPVANETMESTAINSGFTFSGSNSNTGDSVSEGLGGNQGLYLTGPNGTGSNQPLSWAERLRRGLLGVDGQGGIYNVLDGDKYEQFDDAGNVTNTVSPHSTYFCIEASNTCGNRAFSERKQ